MVRLSRGYATTIAQKPYPEAIKRLLGEMMTAASLLISTVKINGRLSIQLQSSDPESLLNWAMAECDQDGIIRALAEQEGITDAQAQAWESMTTAKDAFAALARWAKAYCLSISSLTAATLIKVSSSVVMTIWQTAWRTIKSSRADSNADQLSIRRPTS